MISDKKSIKPGATLVDDIGRRHQIEDVFVPKNAGHKRYGLPSAFRDMPRRVIVFKSGSVALSSDIERRYSMAG